MSLVFTNKNIAMQFSVLTFYLNEYSFYGRGVTLIWEGALTEKFSSKEGRSLERGALSRGGTHSNKCGTVFMIFKKKH